jgi:LCP family protein required for cell wall assembly
MTTPGPSTGSTASGSAASGQIGRRVVAVASGMTLLATALCGAGWMQSNRILAGVHTEDVTNQLGSDRPTKAGESTAATDAQAMNILVMGTDTRTGQGTGFGNAADTASGTGHSDTTILFHVSADRQSALAVSIPRDSVVTRPSCKGGGTVTGRINTAFAEGGAGCAIKAVEHLTGVFIDHYVVVDFKGFKAVVTALGGVQVCLTTAVDDSKSHLKLSAGTHVLDGDQALAFARVRHGIGDGSDISRIGRQQDFLGSMIRAITDKGLLTQPLKLNSVLSAVADSLTTDPQLGDINYDFDLAKSLATLPPAGISFVTVPWTLNSDGATVSWNKSKAKPLWEAMKNDTPYGKLASTTTPAGDKPLTVAPSAIRVKVLNGTGTAGAARAAAAQLTAAGFDVVSTGNAPTTVTASTIVAPAASSESLRTLAYATSIASTSTAGTGEVLTLTVGADWPTTLTKVTIAKASTSATPVKTADQAVCSS